MGRRGYLSFCVITEKSCCISRVPVDCLELHKNFRLDFLCCRRCTSKQGKSGELHQFTLKVKDMLNWQRHAARVSAALQSLTSPQTFPCNRFPSSESSWTLCGKALGHKIWYTGFTLHSLVSSRTTRRVCAVDNIRAVLPIFAFALV